MYLMERNEVISDGYEQLFHYVPSPTMSISTNKLIELVTNGQISRDDMEIITFLYEFSMSSLEQLKKLFEPDEEKLKSKLDKLVRNRILNKFCLVEGEKVFRDDTFLVYCIDKGGAELLKIYKNGEDYQNFKVEKIITPALKVWKRLSLIDFYLRLLESCPSKLNMFQVGPTVFLGKTRLSPHFALAINQDDSDKFFIGEIVCSNDVNIYASTSERFNEKVVRLESLLTTNVWKKSFGLESAPTLLIIAEDDEVAERAAQIISTTTIEKYRLTTPERLKQKLNSKGVFMKFDKEKLKSAANNIFVE